MQTFFNPTTPFLDDEGRPMVGAMVSFLDTETSGSLIEITDNAGTPLPNPIFTGMDGRLRLDNGNGAPAVPCIADGLSYKVTVARRTGVEPVYIGGILQNASELFEAPYIAFVVTAMGQAGHDYPNTTVIGSIAEVRLADKGIGAVVCSGYYSAGDCPDRIFTWIDSQNPPADNAVNILRNPDDGTGYWRMNEPEGGLWDVRIAGMKTSNTPAVNDQSLTALLNIVNGYASTSSIATVYFPAGNWLLDSGFVCASLCLEKGANLKPSDNTSDRTVVVSHLENRGGLFYAYDTSSYLSKRVILKVTGLLRSSWFSGTINEFLTANALENVEEIIFDSITANGGTAVSVSGKRVLQICSLPSSITFTDCERYNVGTGILEANIAALASQLRFGGNYNATLDDGKVKMRYNTNELVNIGNALVEILKSVSMPDFVVGGAGVEGWKVWNDGTDWDGQFFLIAAKAAVQNLRTVNLACGGTATFNKGARNGFDGAVSVTADKTIDDTELGDSTYLNVVAKVSGSYGFYIDITATPTEGRAIKIYAYNDDENYTEAQTVVVVKVNGTTKICLNSGGSVYLIASGGDWVFDLTRL